VNLKEADIRLGFQNIIYMFALEANSRRSGEWAFCEGA
jgi:hypothetical protein